MTNSGSLEQVVRSSGVTVGYVERGNFRQRDISGPLAEYIAAMEDAQEPEHSRECWYLHDNCTCGLDLIALRKRAYAARDALRAIIQTPERIAEDK